MGWCLSLSVTAALHSSCYCAYANWDLPKGGGDGDKAPLQAAVRAMCEETGIDAFEMPWGEVSKCTAIPRSLAINSWLGLDCIYGY